MGEVEGKVNGHGTEIVHAPPVAIAAFEESSDQVLARAAQQIALHQGIVKLIAANISPKQVMLFGDNIWLVKEACLRILGWIGADVIPDGTIREHMYEGPDGPYIVFETWGTVRLKNGREIKAPGNSSTLDDFFAKENIYVCPTCKSRTEFRNNSGFCAKCNKAVRGEKKEHYKPLSEIDVPSVRLKATTNFYNHALQVLGVMPTKEELLAAGMKLGEGGKVDFNKKDSAQAPADQKRQAPKAEAATKEPQNTPAASAAPKEEPKKGKRQRKPQDLQVAGGYISQVWVNTKQRDNVDYRYAKVIMGGRTLLCFHDGPCVTRDGDMNLLDLIGKMKGRYCKFLVKTTGQGSQTKFYIEGALQIGSYGWTEDGMPAKDPATEPENDYKATNEDIPF